MDAAALWLPVAVAVTDWVAVLRGWKRVEYFAKPGVMVILLGWLAWQGILAGVWPAGLTPVAAALLFSLAGDVLLMLPGRYFLGGLGAFLLAHLAYITGFLWSGVLIGAWAIPLAGLVILVAAWLVRRISRSLVAAGKHALRRPVVAYAIVISVMLVTATGTWFSPDWPPGAAALVILGAALFLLSDGVLAWNEFVRPSVALALLVIIAYHAGQILLVAGAAWRWLG